MKKNLIKGMVALCVCALFASCSHDPGFETPNQIELTKNQYKENFIKRYGPIDPNQTWDFTGYNKGSQVRTRAVQGDIDLSGYATDTQVQDAYNFYSTNVFYDKGVVQALLNSDAAEKRVGTKKVKVNGTASIINFTPIFSVRLTPFYAHWNYPSGEYRYFHLKFSDTNNYDEDMVANIRVVGYGFDYWYDANGALPHHTSRDINTNPASSNGFWYTYYTIGTENNTPFYKDAQLQDKHTSEIKYVREIKISVNDVHVRTYWGFDIDGDGNYNDLICLVREFSNPEPIRKRYLIEDLGDADDFDFNDIVVDVEDNRLGQKTAIIRAMGGTLDFTLNIGGTEWTKSIEGAALNPKVEVIDMVNTKAEEVNFMREITSFSVPGWNPDQNNISITLKEKTYNTIYTIQFPHVGEVPMIVAVSPDVSWMTERDPVPSEWWLPKNNNADE